MDKIHVATTSVAWFFFYVPLDLLSTTTKENVSFKYKSKVSKKYKSAIDLLTDLTPYSLQV